MRMNAYIFVLLFLGLGSMFPLHAQEIFVKNRTSLQPVENATVYNLRSGASAVTNAKGNAQIGNTQPEDSLRIQHLNYQTIVITMESIRRKKNTALLTERLLNIGEVVVAANRWEENRRDVPVQISAISPKEIAFTNPQTAGDMLFNLGGVYLQKSQMGGGSPVIRGFEANKVLLVVDGVRMNNAIYRSGHLQNVIMIDPSSLGNAEVVFGPGSVIYGSDALGGVMDFHYFDPEYSSRNGLQLSGNAFARYATANEEKSGHFDLNIGTKRFASMTSVTYSDFGDLRSGNIHNPFYSDWGKRYEYVERMNGEDVILGNDDPNIQKFSGYWQINAVEKLRYKISDTWEAQYGFYYTTTSDIPRYDRLSQYRNGTLRYAEWYYGPQQWMMNSLRVNYDNPGAFVDHGKLTVAYQQIDEDRINRSLGSSNKRHQEEDVNVMTVNLDLDKELAPKHRLFFGAEAALNDVTSTAYSENIETGEQGTAATRYPDGDNTMNTFAGYLSYKWDVSDMWLLSAGTRYSHSTLSSTLVSKEYFDFTFDSWDISNGALTGSIGTVFRPGNKWQFDLNLSSGFRAPNLDDVGKIFDSEPGTVIIRNPDVNPEYAYTGELTVSKEFGPNTLLSVTGYYTALTNAIVVRDFSYNGQDSIQYDGVMSKVQAAQNAGEAYIYGFTGTLSSDITPDFTLSSSLTYTYGWDEDNDVPLDHIPPLYNITRMVYRMDRFRGEFAVTYNSWKLLSEYSPSGEDNLQNATEFGTPEWYILSLRTSYQLTSYLQINVDLENILDTYYKPFASGISGPGRNLVVALRTTF